MGTQMTISRLRLREILVSMLLAISLLLTWHLSQAALTGPFLFDDFPNFENLNEIAGCLNGDRLANYLASFTGTPGRPLAALSFLIDDNAWPSSPYSWKRHNLLLHLLCGVLIFGFTRTLARARHKPEVADWVALGVAAAWMIHPMQLSTSMLTVQRMTQLMTLTSLAACWWTAHRLASRETTWREYVLLLVVGAAMSLIAFLYKENGALLPLYLAITSAWMLRDRKPLASRAGQAYFIALFLPVIGVAAALLYSAFTQSGNGIRSYGAWERLLTESRILWDYLRLILLPSLNGSGIFHDDIVVSRGLLDPPTTLIASTAIIGLFAVAATKHRTWPLLAFAVAWYFGGHLMESTTWPLELYFEHRNYLPMIGVLVAVGISLPSIPSVKVRRAGYLASLIWLTLCAGMTFASAKIWGSTQLQGAIWANEHPESLRAAEFRAKFLVENHDLPSARELIMSGIRRDHRFSGLATHVLLIDCYSNTLTPRSMEWAISLLKTSEFNRSSLDSVSILRNAIQAQTCRSERTEELSEEWRKLVGAMLNNPAYASNDVRSFLYIELLRNGMFRGDYDAVIRNLNAAYAASPNSNLALTMSRLLEDGGYRSEAKTWQKRAETLPSPWPIPWWEWWKKVADSKAKTCSTS